MKIPSSGLNRVPGLLHIALRYSDDILHDILFTDAPGEWFDRWAMDQNDPNVEGARWIDQHSDGFMLFVDCKALSGKQRGVARTQLLLLIQRLGAVAQNRPVAVVWAKSDIPVDDTTRLRLQKEFRQSFKNHKEFEVFAMPMDAASGKTGQGVLDTIDWLLASFETNKLMMPLQISIMSDGDVLLAYRGR